MKVVNTSLLRTMREVEDMLRNALDRFIAEGDPHKALVLGPGVEVTQSESDPDSFLVKMNIPVSYITVDVVVSRKEEEDQDAGAQR